MSEIRFKKSYQADEIVAALYEVACAFDWSIDVEKPESFPTPIAGGPMEVTKDGKLIITLYKNSRNEGPGDFEMQLPDSGSVNSILMGMGYPPTIEEEGKEFNKFMRTLNSQLEAKCK